MNELSASRFIYPHSPLVTPAQRAQLNGHAGHCVWFTGLSGAGKSTLANSLERQLYVAGRHTFLLDGDTLRSGLCQDLDMSPAARSEHIRRTAEVARLMVDAGLWVIVAAISPYDTDRRAARERFTPGSFTLVHVSTPLAVCAARDPKGLYRAAREGRVAQFTGVSSPYELPADAELAVDTSRVSLAEATAGLFTALSRGVRSAGPLC